MWSLTTALLLLFLQQPDNTAEGMKALEAQKYDLAAQSFARAVEADPKDYYARFHLALSNLMLGKDEEAASGFRKVLELKPGLYQAQLYLGIVLLRRKQPAEALPYLESAAEQQPKEFRPKLYLGDARFATDDFARAEQSYRAALEIDPKSGAAELGLARSLARQSKLDEAAPHYRKAVELEPSYNESLLELASIEEKSGRAAEAIAIYRQFPDNIGARERLGQLFLDGGKPAEAIPHLEWAVAKSPTAANLRALAQAYRDNHQPEKELPVLERAAQAEPNNVDLRLDYGRELRDRHKFLEAARQFLEAAKMRPDSVPAWSELAAALNSLEDYRGALAALDRVRALNAETPGHHYLRALILYRTGDLKGALASFQQFLATSQGRNPNQELEARERIQDIERQLKKR